MKKLLLICLLASLNSFSQATLVEDINLGNGSSRPSSKIVFNSEAYFAANNGINGNELWKTDGTTAGTLMLKDIIVGEENGLGFGFQAHVVNGELFFIAASTVNQLSLWKTDGTEAGTVIIKDIPNGNLLVHTDLNNELLFSVGNDLWKSDGTEAGTSILSTGKAIFGNRFMKDNGILYYSSYGTGSQGNELFKTDGTTAGTTLVKDIRSGTGNSFPNNFIVSNNIIFFSADNGSNGFELWKTDGTDVGTEMVKDITLGSGSTFTSSNPMVDFNNELYFTFNTKFWKSDGTESGTVEIIEIEFIKDLIELNNKLVIITYSVNLWESDGTTAGTTQFTTGVDEFYHNSTKEYFGNEMYFQGRNECGYQLWKTDGTELGTTLIKAINPVWDDNHIENMINLDGVAIFNGNDGYNWHGNELWRSDGTEMGTYMIKDINLEGNTGSSPLNLFDYNGTLLFSADNGEQGRELWKTDDGINVTMIDDINPDNQFSNPSSFVEFNGLVYFKAETKEKGNELWKTDGTAAGTELVKDINPDAEDGMNSSSFGNIAVLNNKLYFFANEGTNGFELWESDGTNAGTMIVKDINTGANNSMRNGEIIVYNNELFFNADDGNVGFEFWKSDGTQAGTVLLKDIHSTFSGSPDTFILFNNLIYFKANSLSQGTEVWMSDGTSGGTVLVMDIKPGVQGSSPGKFTVSGSNLFFTASGSNGTEVWRTDGSSTVEVKDINNGSNGSFPGVLTDHNGTLFFSANDGSNGYELWKTDGTNVGTILVKDINATGANQSSNITEMVSFGGSLLFGAADVNQNNKELWRSDGTNAGTVLFQDINPSMEAFGNGSNPKNFLVVGRKLYFNANNGSIGEELWTLDQSALSIDEEEIRVSNITLFPNPVKDSFQLSTNNLVVESVEIYSLLGRKIASFPKANLPTNGVYNITNLPTGIYIVKIKTDHMSISKKILKK
ncbi:ELWxxDGT repeat protein [Psychroserpens sp.]